MPIVAVNIVVQRDVIYRRPDGAAVLGDIAYPEARVTDEIVSEMLAFIADVEGRPTKDTK